TIYMARDKADEPLTDPDELFAVAETSSEYARIKGISGDFKFILNDLIDDDILKKNKDFWKGEALAGELLLEKYNRPDAITAFDHALEINPNAADALVGKAAAAFQQFEMKDAEVYADRALKINSSHVRALKIKADVLLVAGDWAAAERKLNAARKTN